MHDQGGVEGFVVEIAHGQHRGARAVHLQHPLMEVAQGFPGDVTVSGRLGGTAAAGGPVVAEHRPHPATGAGHEVDLHDVESGTFWGRLCRKCRGLRCSGEGGVPAVEVVGELLVEDSAADL